MVDYEYIHELVDRLKVEEDGWAGRIAPAGETFDLDDGSTLWLGSKADVFPEVEHEDERNEWYALLGLKEQFISARLIDGADDILRYAVSDDHFRN